MMGTGPGWYSRRARVESVRENGEGPVQRGAARVRDQHNKRMLWGFAINPSSNWRCEREIARPSTFNAGGRSSIRLRLSTEQHCTCMLSTASNWAEAWCFSH